MQEHLPHVVETAVAVPAEGEEHQLTTVVTEQEVVEHLLFGPSLAPVMAATLMSGVGS